MANNQQNTPAKQKKKFSEFLKSLIYKDKYLAVVSILIAIVIWIAVSLNVGTEETKTIKAEVPIALSDQVSEQLGMQYYSLQDTIEISVTVSGAKYAVGQVSEEDLDFNFDTSSVNKTGEQTIPILVTNNSKTLDFEVDSVYPSSIEAYYDVNSSKTFDVSLNYDDSNVADGYTFGTPVLSEEKIVVSGPKTYIDKISDVYCQVDFGESKDLTEAFNQECDIHYDGEALVTNYLTASSRTDMDTPITKLSVTLPVLKEVTLPVTSEFEDEPADLPSGIVSVSYSVDSVKAGVLSTADISNANIGSIFFNELTVGTQSFDFSTDKISGVTVLDGTSTITATVTVSSSYAAQNITVSSSSIILEGDDEMSVQYMDDTSVTVLAPRGTTITASDLTMKCDVSKSSENNKYPITITVNNSKCWVYGKYMATVK